MPLPSLSKGAVIAAIWIFITAPVIALQPDFASVFEACPAPYQDGIYPNNWTTYHGVDRLAWCNETQLLDFALYNPLDDPATHISIRATIDVPDAPASRGTAKRNNRESSSKCGTATKASVTVQRASWGVEGAINAEIKSHVVAAAQQIQKFLSAEEHCDVNSILGYSGSGAAAVGVYVGGQLENHGAADTFIQQLIHHVKTEGMGHKLLFQYCGEDADYVLGIVVDTAANNLPEVQRIVRSWTDGKCITNFESSKDLVNTDIWIFPQTGLKELLLSQSNGTSTNATSTNATSTNAILNSRSLPWPKSHAHAHQLHVRAACTSYKSVVAGDTCTTLVAKCGITAAQFTTYNPATNLCSTLAVGQIVCCSSGTVPDLTPKPNADGSCYSYLVASGQYCAMIASTFTITVEKIESVNKQTWGWMGCNNLQAGQKICLSTGDPPMPAAVVNVVCGPQVPGTIKPAGTTLLASLNPCPLNACCNIWGQCGTTADFCTISTSTTGAPGTSAPGTNGCISNCGTDIVNNGSPPAQFKRIGYYEAWNRERDCLHMDVTDIDVSMYTHIHFAFATITPDFNVDIGPVVEQFAKFAALRGVKRILSFGGWSFSTSQDSYPIFRTAVTAANRQIFANNVVAFILGSGLDGVDFDWEYPGAPDIPGIPAGDPADGENYHQFLTQVWAGLKAKDSTKSVSVAMPASFWYLKGFPVAKLASYLDYIVYMTYDLHGQWDFNNQWSSPGCPSGNCLRSHINMTETINALSMLTKAGMPASSIIVGVTSYGRSFKMTTKGCTGPMCTYTGPASGAAPGRCTKAAGYIANAEIKEIITRGGNIQKQWDADTLSDILIYDDTEWVAYMDPTTKNMRTGLYKGYNMGGIVDWAIDLEDTVIESSNGGTGTGTGTTAVQHRSPASATVIPYSATNVAATATFTVGGPVVSEIRSQSNTGNQNQPQGPGAAECENCDLARLITSTCCGVGGGVSNPIEIPAGIVLPRDLILPKGFIPNQNIADVQWQLYPAGQPLPQEIVIPGSTVFPFPFVIPPGLDLSKRYSPDAVQDQSNLTMYLVSTFWEGPHTVSCSYPCTMVFPPITTTTTWTPAPFVTTVSGTSTAIILPPYTTEKIRISRTAVSSTAGSSPTIILYPIAAPKPLCIQVTLPILGTITFGLCPPALQPFPPSVPLVTVIPVPPGGKPGPVNPLNKPTPEQEEGNDEEDNSEEDEKPMSCPIPVSEDGDIVEEVYWDPLGTNGIGTGAGIGTPVTVVVTATATVTSTTITATTTRVVTVPPTGDAPGTTSIVTEPVVITSTIAPVASPTGIPPFGGDPAWQIGAETATCWHSGWQAVPYMVTDAIDAFCKKMDGESADQNDFYKMSVNAGAWAVIDIYVTLTNHCTATFGYEGCKRIFEKVKDCHLTAGLAVGGYVESNCWKFTLDPNGCFGECGSWTDLEHTHE